MEQFMVLTKRNLDVYLRDKGAVFFSFLTAIIVICLMLFFLGDMNIEATAELLEQFIPGKADVHKENAELLLLAWTSAGILSINAVTVSLAVYSGMIKDRVSGKLNAIYTAPVNRFTIALSYIASAWAAAVVMCLLTLAITEGYGIAKGMQPYGVREHLFLVGMILLNAFVYAALLYPLAMIAKTEGAWSGFGTVIGTLVGFLGGIYIPIGSLSAGVAGVMKCTPVIYAAAMFRKVMTGAILKTAFEGVPEQVVSEYEEIMGIRLSVSEHMLTLKEEWMILAVCGIIFLTIGICMLKYEKKTDR